MLSLAACGFDDTLVGARSSFPTALGEDASWSPFPDAPAPTPAPDPDLEPQRTDVVELPAIVGLGSRGSGLALSGDVLYVADREHGRVVVMTRGSLDVTRAIDVGGGPEQLVVADDGALYATLPQDNEVVRIDPNRPGGQVVARRLHLDGGPWGIAIDQIGMVWVSLSTGGAVVSLDHELGKVHDLHTIEGTPRGVCVDGLGRVAVVTQRGALHVYDRLLDAPWRDDALVVDTDDSVGTHALAVAPDPRADRFDVPLGIAHRERPMDGSDGAPIEASLVTRFDGIDPRSFSDLAIDQPADVVHHPSRGLVFVVATGTNSVSLIATERPAVLRTMVVGTAPRAVAIDASGTRLYVLSAGDFTVRELDVDGVWISLRRTRAYADDPLPVADRLGRQLFYDTSAFGPWPRLACASCHVLGGSDGIAWRVHQGARQTPLLAGRMQGTAPYGWDGQSATLADAVREAITARGADADAVPVSAVDALARYLATWLTPPPRPALDNDRWLRTRGAGLFVSVGCAGCHSGPTFSDERLWDVGTGRTRINTPSLLDVFASAPYFHDGSAPTLAQVLRQPGHGPAQLARADEVALIAYLRSL